MRKDETNKTNTRGSKSPRRTKNAKSTKDVAKSSDRFGSDREFANDPNWYNVEPNITKDAASIPYAIPAGSKINTANVWNTRSDAGYSVPGVLSITLAPTVGTAQSAADPINLAAQQMYAFVTHANSRNTSYDAADLMQYVLAMTEAYSYVEFLKRAYGVARLYTYDNKYVPATLLQSMSIDPIDIRYKMADFRLGINMLVNKLAAFAVPNTMSIFNRKAFLYKGLYTEGPSLKDQIYLFNPEAFMFWDWKNAKLVCTRFEELGRTLSSTYPVLAKTYSAPYSVEGLLNIGNALIDLLLNNADMGTMNGDILKAYGTDNIVHVEQIPEDYVIVPVVNVGVLEQFRNATLVPDLDIETCGISSSYDEEGADEGASILTSRPQLTNKSITDSLISTWTVDTPGTAVATTTLAMLNGRKIMATTQSNVDPSYNLEITRLMVGMLAEHNTDDYALVSGTEIPVQCMIYYNPNKNPHHVYNSGIFPNELDLTCMAMTTQGTYWNAYYQEVVRNLIYSNTFKFMPVLYGYGLQNIENVRATLGSGHYNDASSSADIDVSNIHEDNYTTVGIQDLYNMHMVAHQNLYYVPKIAIAGYK